MSAYDATGEDRPVRSEDELLDVFRAAEKPPSAFRIGAEAEKFGIHQATLAPLSYAGPFGVERILRTLAAGPSGWQPEAETEGGPIIALRRGAASITLEPGGQFELSGAPLETVHEVAEEARQHQRELASISRELEILWLGVGFHPLARPSDLPWVPKQRYGIMKRYLPERGSGAHDMMRRTATVQVNLDFENERAAMRRLVTCLRLAPLVNAMTANSPFIEGRQSGKRSLRGEVWLRMDPERSGLVSRLWGLAEPRYRDYVEWALDAGMFLFKRGDRVINNAGQPFREFLKHGFEGHRASLADFKLHLNTLFPEIRLKNTLEVRPCDSLPLELSSAVPALFVGLLYDDQAFEQAEALARSLELEAVQAARLDLTAHGLRANIGSTSAQQLAERLIEIALGGLSRRARTDALGRDEGVHLQPLAALVEKGRSPADALLEAVGPAPTTAQIAHACRW